MAAIPASVTHVWHTTDSSVVMSPNTNAITPTNLLGAAEERRRAAAFVPTGVDSRDEIPSALSPQGVPLWLIESQKLWEVEGTNRAIKAYRLLVSNPATSLVDIPPGQTVLRDVVPRLITLIEEAQKEARDRISNATRGHQASWWWLIGLLDADVMALTVATDVLSGVDPAYPTMDRSITSVALSLAKKVEFQTEVSEWIDTERDKARTAKKAGERYLNMFETLKKHAKVVDLRAVKTWWKKIEKARDEPWDTADAAQFGTKLVELLVEAGGGWFEVVMSPLPGGKTERRVRLTSLAKDALENLNTRQETACNFPMPMLAPPQPWRYEPAA